MNTIDNLIHIKKLVQGGLIQQPESLQHILKFEVSCNYLFESLLTKAFNPEDFATLYKYNGFSAKCIPSEVKTITVNGSRREVIQSWVATPYLKKASNYLTVNHDQELTAILRDIIYAYITFSLANRPAGVISIDDAAIGEVILNLSLEYVFIDQNLEFLRTRCLKGPYLTVCNEIIETFYPRVLDQKDTNAALQTIRLLFDYEIKHHGYHSAEAKVQDYYLKDFVTKFADDSSELLSLRLVKLLFDLVEAIDSDDNYAFTSIHLNSLFSDSRDDHFEKFQVILFGLLKTVLRKLSHDEAKEALNLLRYYDRPVFYRIKLFIIGYFYEEKGFHDCFWNLDNPFNNIGVESELTFILSKYRHTFNSWELDQFTEWIGKLNLVHYNGEADDDYSARILKAKHHWLTVLREGYEPHYSGEEAIFQSSESIPEDQHRLTHADEVILMRMLSAEDNWRGYNQSGLIADIKQLDLDRRRALLFSKEAVHFLPEVLWALVSTFEIEENMDWNPFMGLVSSLIKTGRFWDFSSHEKVTNSRLNAYHSNYNSDLWKAVSEVFRQAASHRNHSYLSYENSQKAISLLMEIEEHSPAVFKILNKDQEYLNAINTVKGSVFETVINLSVAMAIIRGNKEFYTPVKKWLTTKLNMINPPQELLWVIGGALIKIGYMDIYWIEANKYALFESPAGEGLNVLKGYLLYTTTAYKDLYLITHPYYLKAVQQFSVNANHTAKLIQHICIAGINEWPEAELMMHEILELKTPTHYQEIIKHFSAKPGRKDDRRINFNAPYIISLWRRLINELDRNDMEGKEKMGYNLLQWTAIFDDLTEEIIGLVYRNLELIDNYPFDFTLMAYLKEMSSRYPEIVGKILIAGLNRSNGFDITGHQLLMDIVTNLYISDAAVYADGIANKLAERNCFFLVDLYESYHNLTS